MEEDGGGVDTCFVDEWDFKLTFQGEGVWWDTTFGSDENPTEFAVEPD